ncbi:MAG: hypothetical protein QOJ29_2994 [Thermoleophilaceae bacterium]|jgi:hypothetical protein|nr:hypothetical protein [Thermoleophilaceae bacterium]
MKTKHFVLAALVAGTGIAGGGALLTGANAATVCTPTPQTLVAACAGADTHLSGLGVSSAESATIWVGGTPTPTCIGRIDVGVSPTPVQLYPPLIYTCY